MKSKWVNLLILLAVVVLAAVPLLMIPGKDKDGKDRFTGSDDQAKDMVTEVQPDYKPWFSSVWEPPSGEIESLLFALQAGIGAGVIGYYFGLKRGQARKGPQVTAHASN